MAEARNERRTGLPILDGIQARLGEAARTGDPLNLILTVRGRVSPVPGKPGRWRVRTSRGYVISFRSEFVLAFDGTGGVATSSTEILPPETGAESPAGS